MIYLFFWKCLLKFGSAVYLLRLLVGVHYRGVVSIIRSGISCAFSIDNRIRSSVEIMILVLVCSWWWRLIFQWLQSDDWSVALCFILLFRYQNVCTITNFELLRCCYLSKVSNYSHQKERRGKEQKKKYLSRLLRILWEDSLWSFAETILCSLCVPRSP